mgnify:CR=1 FL=1
MNIWLFAGFGAVASIPQSWYKILRVLFAFSRNLNCSKLLVPKSKKCGSFGIFGSSPTLLCSMYVDTRAGQWPN